MPYTTAKTNWLPSDYYNVADWTRLYRNAQLAASLAEIELVTTIVFNSVAAPTITSIASVTDFNTLLANIERARLAVVGESIPGTGTEIKDDYVAGVSNIAPNYIDANLWESTIDAIWNYFNGGSLPVCPTLVADLTITTGNYAVYVDCIDAADFNIDLQGSANLYII